MVRSDDPVIKWLLDRANYIQGKANHRRENVGDDGLAHQIEEEAWHLTRAAVMIIQGLKPDYDPKISKT